MKKLENGQFGTLFETPQRRVEIPIHTPEELYPPHLDAQIKEFITELEDYNSTKPEYVQQDERNYRFAEDFYQQLFTNRTQRTYEVESPQYQEIKNKGNSEFPVPTYFVDCIDGRVLEVIAHGASYGIGGSIRVPGGIVKEFVRGENGQMILRNKSTYAKLIQDAVDKSPEKRITQVLDSHVGCAARGKEEASGGKHPADGGLLTDVLHKREMSLALKQYARDQLMNEHSVIPIQKTYNIKTGYMYMGLETNKALDFAKEHAKKKAILDGKNPATAVPVYTDEVLFELNKKGIIIDTEHLIRFDPLRFAFDMNSDFNFDWKSNFLDTAEHFWNGIQKIKQNPEIMQFINNEILTIYPDLEKTNNSELEERAMLLLTNSFSGYLLNKSEKIHNDRPFEKPYLWSSWEEKDQYYGHGPEHLEEFVKVYEGGQPPYDISAFVVSSLDVKNMPANIELAAELVRQNRREGRVTDRTHHFKDPQEFEQAVVPLVVQEIVRGDITEEEWEQFASINWSDLPKNWDTQSSTEFFEYLHKKGVIPQRAGKLLQLFKGKWTDEELFAVMESSGIDIPPLAIGIDNLRGRMAGLYYPDAPTSAHLVDHKKIALPAVSGQNRRIKFIVPFVKLGFNAD